MMNSPAQKKKGFLTAYGGIKPLPRIELTEKELAALRNGAVADMQKHGFHTVEELNAYYDSKRGY